MLLCSWWPSSHTGAQCLDCTHAMDHCGRLLKTLLYTIVIMQSFPQYWFEKTRWVCYFSVRKFSGDRRLGWMELSVLVSLGFFLCHPNFSLPHFHITLLFLGGGQFLKIRQCTFLLIYTFLAKYSFLYTFCKQFPPYNVFHFPEVAHQEGQNQISSRQVGHCCFPGGRGDGGEVGTAQMHWPISSGWANPAGAFALCQPPNHLPNPSHEATATHLLGDWHSGSAACLLAWQATAVIFTNP